MAVRVILYRRVPVEKSAELAPLLVELRSLAVAQPGYISGETLMNRDDPEEVLVISTWANEDSWERWVANEKRQALQKQVDGLLGRETLYQVYYNA